MFKMMGDGNEGNNLPNNTIVCRWVLKDKDKEHKENVKAEENWADGATLKLRKEKGAHPDKS